MEQNQMELVNMLTELVEQEPAYVIGQRMITQLAQQTGMDAGAAAEALLLQMGKAVPDPACGETAQALAGGLDRRRLYGLTALLEKYSGECVYNVGAGHVLGALAVEWEELL